MKKSISDFIPSTTAILLLKILNQIYFVFWICAFSLYLYVFFSQLFFYFLLFFFLLFFYVDIFFWMLLFYVFFFYNHFQKIVSILQQLTQANLLRFHLLYVL